MPSLPADADLRCFERYASAFAESGFVNEFSPPPQTDPHLIALLPWESPAIVWEWHQALYDQGVIDPDSDYLSEGFAARMRQFGADPSLLADADLQTIRTVLTNISRGERFCDGYMASMFENGIAKAATDRLVAIERAKGVTGEYR